MKRALLVIAACSHSPELPTALAKPPSEVAVGREPVELAVGDLDGDGKLDLVSANAGDRTLSVRLQRAGTWRPAGELALDVQPHLVALADVDADRDLDIIAAAHDSGAVWIWLGDGRGRFTPAPRSPITAIDSARPHNHGLAVGDVDGDGDADIVAADQTARTAAVLLADGSGGFAAPARIELGGQPYPPALGDVDGDGRADLVVPLIDRQAIAVLLGDGRGGFQPAKGSPVRTPHPRPYGIALADLDRDRRLDIIVAHDDTDEIAVVLGANLRSGPAISTGRRIGRPTTADVDGDGALDLLGAGSGSLVVMRGDGRGGFGAPQVEPSGSWRAVAADLDRDGKIDVLAPEPTAGTIRIWPGR